MLDDVISLFWKSSLYRWQFNAILKAYKLKELKWSSYKSFWQKWLLTKWKILNVNITFSSYGTVIFSTIITHLNAFCLYLTGNKNERPIKTVDNKGFISFRITFREPLGYETMMLSCYILVIMCTIQRRDCQTRHTSKEQTRQIQTYHILTKMVIPIHFK